MADFRKWFTVLAVLAVMAGAASAQVGVAQAGAGAANGLLCSATGAGIPELRPEGYTELAGDILITCTGGTVPAQGTLVPVTNITIYTEPSSAVITSRFLSSSGQSDALLIIDEAGSTVATGAQANANGTYGPLAPQSLCTVTAEQAYNSGGNFGNGSSCTAFVGQTGGFDTLGHAVNYAVSVTSTGAPAQNVYQGKIGDYGTNSVTFYNVPVLPPATTGVTRVFRITNVRVPVVGLAPQATLQAIVSTSPNTVLPVSGTAINIGIVGQPMTAGVKLYSPSNGNYNPFKECIAETLALTANLIFTEGFATGFKTRVVPGGAYNGIPGNATGNTIWAAEGSNTNGNTGSTGSSIQNIPGGLYGGFAQNSESGFIFPQLATSNNVTVPGAINYVAGLADYGTRLKAVFSNIPAGLSVYVSQTSGQSGGASAVVPTSMPSIPGGTSVLPWAVLVAGNSGEATQDSYTNGVAAQGFANIIGQSFYVSRGSTVPQFGQPDLLPVVQLTPNAAGQAVAVWEVTNSNPSAIDVFSFSVYIYYTPTAPTATNPYGTPVTGVPPGTIPPGSNIDWVSLSFAPEPSGGTFTTANATQGQGPTPRFAVPNAYGGSWTEIQLCQTTLLYPYVITGIGLDTGISVANTSADPFGTTNQEGSCSLYAYGVTLSTTGGAPTVNPAPPKGGSVPGCDTIANPVPGTNCFGGAGSSLVIQPGTVGTVDGATVLPNFQGYVIAICNFQYAHGYAAVTDLGIRNIFSSYLALELQNILANGNTRPSNPGSIEVLAH